MSNMPSIAMEEIAPVAVSDANLLAPEEVQEHVRGELKSTTEKEKTDRLRERRQKKASQRMKQKERERVEKAVSKANPGLGNKHARNRVLEKLQKAEKEGTVSLVSFSFRKFHFFIVVSFDFVFIADQGQWKAKGPQIVNGFLQSIARRSDGRSQRGQTEQTGENDQEENGFPTQIVGSSVMFESESKNEKKMDNNEWLFIVVDVVVIFCLQFLRLGHSARADGSRRTRQRTTLTGSRQRYRCGSIACEIFIFHQNSPRKGDRQGSRHRKSDFIWLRRGVLQTNQVCDSPLHLLRQLSSSFRASGSPVMIPPDEGPSVEPLDKREFFFFFCCLFSSEMSRWSCSSVKSTCSSAEGGRVFRMCHAKVAVRKIKKKNSKKGRRLYRLDIGPSGERLRHHV